MAMYLSLGGAASNSAYQLILILPVESLSQQLVASYLI